MFAARQGMPALRDNRKSRRCIIDGFVYTQCPKAVFGFCRVRHTELIAEVDLDRVFLQAAGNGRGQMVKTLPQVGRAFFGVVAVAGEQMHRFQSSSSAASGWYALADQAGCVDLRKAPGIDPVVQQGGVLGHKG